MSRRRISALLIGLASLSSACGDEGVGFADSVILRDSFPSSGSVREDDKLRYIEAMLGDGGLDTPYRWNHTEPLGTPATVSYSFMQALPTRWEQSHEPSQFLPLSDRHRSIIREGFRQISLYANANFCAQECIHRAGS